MNYKQVIITNINQETSDILIALLTENAYEGFEEGNETLTAFIPDVDFDSSVLEQTLLPFGLTYTLSDIAKTNWNKQWEEHFQPVIVDDFCTVRADFHQMDLKTPYEIVITPKMSFGTGHHATTQLMMRMMRTFDFTDQKVFDFGTGTGILAILAAMLGAKSVLGIDNDEWSYENAIENITRNNIQRETLNIQLGSIDIVVNERYNIILANINRHILLQYMSNLYELTNTGGKVLLSGLLTEDRDIIIEAALKQGFLLVAEDSLNNWITLLFSK